MENGNIADSQITSSTSLERFASAKGRLNGATAWAAGQNDQNQWIQVDLGEQKIVTKIATQGRNDYDQWVTSYGVSYSLNGQIFNQYQVHSIDKVRYNQLTVYMLYIMTKQNKTKQNNIIPYLYCLLV